MLLTSGLDSGNNISKSNETVPELSKQTRKSSVRRVYDRVQKYLTLGM